MKTKTGLEFLLAPLPQDDRKAAEHIRSVRSALLAQYDRHVLGTYDIGRELRYLLNQGVEVAGVKIHINDAWRGGSTSPKTIANKVLHPLKPRFARLCRYVARRAFLRILENDAELAEYDYPQPHYECNTYMLRRAYLTLAHMVAQAVPDKK